MSEVEQFLTQICAAVAYAHARQIAHLDLKPDNLLLHEDGRLVLSDFGLAHLLKQGRLEAGTSASWGTPHYMAPEQIRGKPELQSDIYALGIMLYRLLTNRFPFPGNTPEAVMMMHLLETPPPLHTVAPDLPTALEPVVQKALAKKPEDRFATADALLASFRNAIGISSLQQTQPPTPLSSTLISQSVIPSLKSVQTSGGGCEIPLNNGSLCGVTTQGRCTTCGRAFCSTHQAYEHYNYGLVPYVDMCAPCLATIRAAQEQLQQEEWAKKRVISDEALAFVRSGAARRALLAAGIPSVDIYQVQTEMKKKFFGGLKTLETITAVQRGWVIGDIEFEHEDEGEHSQVGSRRRYNHLCALLDQQEITLIPVLLERLMSKKEVSEMHYHYDRDYLKKLPIKRVKALEDLGYVSRNWEVTESGLLNAARRVRWLIERHNALSKQGSGLAKLVQIVEGKETGRAYEIEGAAIIGSSEVCDISEYGVRPLQAMIIQQGNNGYALRNGDGQAATLINLQQLQEDQLCPLKDGDYINFGGFNETHMFVFKTK